MKPGFSLLLNPPVHSFMMVLIALITRVSHITDSHPIRVGSIRNFNAMVVELNGCRRCSAAFLHNNNFYIGVDVLIPDFCHLQRPKTATALVRV